MPSLAAPDRDVDAFAEVPAGEAPARMLGGRIEGYGLHVAAIMRLCGPGEQRLSRRSPEQGDAMQAWDKQEQRSQKIADALRALLTALATAGIGAAYALSQTTSHALWLVSAIAFVVSLACVVRSWFVAKDRALRRRDASLGTVPLEITKWSWKSSWLWDTFAAWALIIGAVLLVVALAPSLVMTIAPFASSIELGGLLLTLLATAAGAWAGGAAAFRGEREKREQDRRRDQAAAIERALFVLFRFHRLVASLTSDFVVPIEAEPVLKFMMKPTLDSGWASPQIDIATLDFLHSTPQQMVLTKLLERDEGFQIIVALVRARSRMVEDWVKPLAEKHPMPLPDGTSGFDANAILRELTLRQREDLTHVSDELIDSIKREMVELPKTQAALAGVYRTVFPDRKPTEYLAVTENKKPPATESRGLGR
jgi:hypothetical protein